MSQTRNNHEMVSQAAAWVNVMMPLARTSAEAIRSLGAAEAT
ncbi:hypothetical protein [Rubellimicrobium rubrum]|nr:hypothetical protein [Rubellimicrobium rubrum]